METDNSKLEIKNAQPACEEETKVETIEIIEVETISSTCGSYNL